MTTTVSLLAIKAVRQVLSACVGGESFAASDLFFQIKELFASQTTFTVQAVIIFHYVELE